MTVDEVIRILNDLLERDAESIGALMRVGVPCNESLMASPNIFVVQNEGRYIFGVLGLINGFFGQRDDGRAEIAFVIKDGRITGFARTPAA